MLNRKSAGTGIVILSMAASIAMSYFGVSTILYTLPMLLLHKRVLDTGKCVLFQALTYIAVLALSVYPYLGYLTPENFGIIIFGIMFTLVQALEALIYTAMDKRSSSVLRKLVAAAIPAFAIGTFFCVWITSEGAQQSLTALKTSFEAILASMFSNLNAPVTSDLLMTSIIVFAVPMLMCFSTLPILISEFALHSSDEDWQEDFANMKLPGIFSVLLLLAVLSVVPGYFVETYPKAIVLAGLNITFGLMLHFMMNGFSILVSLLRRRTAYVSATRLFVLVMLMSFVPGLNIAVIAGLTLLAVLENWIKFR